MLHHYAPRDPIAEFFRGEITLRKLRVMVEHLPPDGALARTVAGTHWQHETYLLTDIKDIAARHYTAFLNANRDEKASVIPYPERSWRPGDPLPEEKAAADAERERQARRDYEDIVALVTPDYAQKG